MVKEGDDAAVSTDFGVEGAFAVIHQSCPGERGEETHLFAAVGAVLIDPILYPVRRAAEGDYFVAAAGVEGRNGCGAQSEVGGGEFGVVDGGHGLGVAEGFDELHRARSIGRVADECFFAEARTMGADGDA